MTTENKIDYIVTPKFRLSFPSLFEPTAMDETQKKKYSMTMLFPKGTDFKDFNKLIKARVIAKYGTDYPKTLQIPKPLDGNEKSYEGYKDMLYLKASSLNRPGVVDVKRQPILNSADLYPGCWCVASITAYVWEHRAKTGAIIKQGVSLGIRSIMKVKDDQAFVGSSNPQEEFASIEIEADDLETGGEDADLFDL